MSHADMTEEEAGRALNRAYLKINSLKEQKKHYRLAVLKAVGGDKDKLKKLLDETEDEL